MTPSEDRVLNKLREEIARIIADAINRVLSRTFSTVWVAPSDDIPFAASGEILAAWNRRADPLVEELRGALERLAREVFGSQAGDEPDVYADYDKLIELERLTREALALPVGGGSAQEPAQATQVSSDPTANADGSEGGELPHGDTPWRRAADEKPICDGWGERYLLTWCTRTATYDIGCINGDWTAGEAIDVGPAELWRWLDVNPERHLAALAQPDPLTETSGRVDGGDQ